jgi:hypothetical protein
LFFDYSEADILAFKHLDSPIHVVTVVKPKLFSSWF